MNWIVTPINEVPAKVFSMWRALLNDAPVFESPYFRPEYVQLCSTVLPNIEVAYRANGDQIDAIFAFERVGDRDAIVVGRDLGDYEGVIRRPGFHVVIVELLQSANLTRWRFDHAFPVVGDCDDEAASENVSAIGALDRWCWARWDSPQIRLDDGAEVYLKQLFAKRKKLGSNFRRARKKISKEIGELRIETRVKDPALLDLCLEWKSQQYESTKRFHPFRKPWVRDLLLAAIQSDSNEFWGALDVVYAGESPIAMEYSFQTPTVLHMLICTFDVEHQSYSPGFVRDIGLIESGARDSFQVIDMGKGVEAYKERVMNASASVGEGCVDLRPIRARLQQSYHRARIKIVVSPRAQGIKTVVRNVAEYIPALRRILRIR